MHGLKNTPDNSSFIYVSACFLLISAFGYWCSSICVFLREIEQSNLNTLTKFIVEVTFIPAYLILFFAAIRVAVSDVESIS